MKVVYAIDCTIFVGDKQYKIRGGDLFSLVWLTEHWVYRQNNTNNNNESNTLRRKQNVFCG